MHKKLKALEKLYAECERTDQNAKTFGLRIASNKEEVTHFHWGTSEQILPLKAVSGPMRLCLTRDVFLMPDSNIAHDYGLGFEEDWETGSEQLFVAYRISLVHRFTLGPNQDPEYEFPVTVFQDLVGGRWRGTARIRYGEEKNSPFVRPPEWTSVLAKHGLDSFGELADGISSERARKCIDGMLMIATMHIPTPKQYEQVFGKVLYA